MEPPKPSQLLSNDEMARIRGWVHQYLPSFYDRDFIADTIIFNAYLKQVPHVSRQYVRHKCISAWRTLRRESTRNERAFREGRVRGDHIGHTKNNVKNRGPEEEIERKILINETTKAVLTPFERKLIWMRFYNDQSLEEISENVKIQRARVQAAIQVALYKMRIHLT